MGPLRAPPERMRARPAQGQSNGQVTLFSPQKPPSQKKLPHLQKPRQSAWQLAAFSPEEVSQKPSPHAIGMVQSLGQLNGSSPGSQKRLPQMPICAQSWLQFTGFSQLGLQKKSPQKHAMPQSCGQENGSSK